MDVQEIQVPSLHAYMHTHACMRAHTYTPLSQSEDLFPAECACMLSQSCPSLFNPMGCSAPGSSVHGIPQVSILEWIAISSSRGSSHPRDRT